jgi:hypothetical protein
MSRLFLAFFAALATFATYPAPAAAQTPPIERGLAITNADTLALIEQRSFSLTAFMSPDWEQGAIIAPANNHTLAARPEFDRVFSGIRREIAEIKKANPGSGIGMTFDNKRLFDHAYLTSPTARFALTGIVQRLDRTYKQAATCGEVRLLYRLEYKRDTPEGLAMSRLPMTFNLVMRSKAPVDPITCQDIAKRWLAAGDSTLTGKAYADYLMSPHGPLSLIRPALVDRIETNLQALRMPSASLPEFGGHADYVLKVFDWNGATRRFNETALENMIDRKKLLADPALLARFKSWLLEPNTVRALDSGTILIPREYLALGGVSIAPGGLARSANRPFYGLFDDAELADAIARTSASGDPLRNISSPAGFQMRLNDTTCVGCHQSRAIGGFHFMGADTRESKAHLPENAIFVPTSAHFYGDAPRRQRILKALATGKPADFMRGFSVRPRRSLATNAATNPTVDLTGTGHLNGWGAACYDHPDADPSFRAWTCAAGLKCVKPHDNPDDPGHGTCMTKADYTTGDVSEYGRIQSTAFRTDHYTRLKPAQGETLTLKTSLRSAPQAGGFFGGMIYKKSCAAPMPANTACARHAASRFNECLATAQNFKKCFDTDGHYTEFGGLRECNTLKPCRDDYMCIATRDTTSGACLPPYFMMQFRVDGHAK